MATGSDAVVSARKQSYPGKGKATRQPAALKTLFMALLEKQESHIDTYRLSCSFLMMHLIYYLFPWNFF